MSSSLLLQQFPACLDSFRGGWWVAEQLLFCGVLSPWLVQYRSQDSCVIAVKPFS